MISYSWDCDMDKFISALEQKAAAEEENDPSVPVFFWIDIFSLIMKHIKYGLRSNYMIRFLFYWFIYIINIDFNFFC